MSNAASIGACRRYVAMGAVVESDFPFRDLEPASQTQASIQPAVRIARERGGFPPFGELVREVAESASGRFLRVYVSDEGLQWDVAGVGRFWLRSDGCEVLYDRHATAAAGDVEQILLGPVLGVAFQIQGAILLHASAALFASGVAAFTAQGGFGKSTLVAQLGRLGFPLVADDVLPLRMSGDSLLAAPYVPRLKLWEQSLAALGEDVEAYDRVLSWHTKRRVKPGSQWGQIAGASAPLAVVYVLAPHLDGGAHIEIAPIEELDATLRVAASMYMVEIATAERSASQLRAACDIVARVPVRCLIYPRSLELLEPLAAAIAADVRAQAEFASR